MNFKKDYYKILGVPENASKESIKAAYRALAKKYHPDVNQGSTQSEELLKEVNEAYEVVGDDTNRFIYDEYRNEEQRLYEEELKRQQEEQQQKEKEEFKRKHTRTYTKKTTVRTEKRVYVTGTIEIKYTAELNEELTASVLKDAYYRIYPTRISAIILKENIYHSTSIPEEFQKYFSDKSLFTPVLKQPIKCTIKSSAGEEFYELDIKDITIPNPTIENVTKHEGGNFGTIKGTFCGYVQHFYDNEVEEEVTECFGETGRIETKTEDGQQYYRKEYYHKNCTTYWGPWIKIDSEKEKTGPIKPTDEKPPDDGFRDGCSTIFWVLFFLLLLFFAPKFILTLLIIGAIVALLGLGYKIISIAAGILRIISAILLLLFLFFAFKSCYDTYRGKNAGYKPPKKVTNTIKKTETPVTKEDSATTEPVNDSIISHYIEWKDFDSIPYAATFSIYASDFRNSKYNHANLDIEFRSKEDFGRVYEYLKDNDTGRLKIIYHALDSLKEANQLNSKKFAEVVVSLLQSIPYSLVVEDVCDPLQQNDSYARWYLSQCIADCCIGDSKYGVRSPVEFFSDLKGDCDTRALLLYTILQHYNYGVALLTSQVYKHAILAVYFDGEQDFEGSAFTIRNKSYYLWETTSFGFRAGHIPDNISNLSYWDLTLLSDKTITK